MDAEPVNDPSKPKVAGPGGPDSSFDWRLEVKSVPFHVFSAKKFPGLAESTILSRTVAEQGCRVRIRRDVRMRRRDGKTGSEYDEMADDEYSRSRRTPTPPQSDAYRQRSLSAHGLESPAFEGQRRPSGDYGAQPYSSYNTSQSGPPSYLSFGGSTGSQYQAPPPPPSTQPQFPPPASQPSYQQSQGTYSHPGSQYRQNAQAPPPPPPPSGFAVPERPPYQQYSNGTPSQRDGYEAEYRRASTAYGPSGQAPPYLPADSNYSRTSSTPSYQGFARPHSPSVPGSVNLAPLKMPPLEPKYEHASSPAGPLPPASRLAPPLPSPSFERAPERPGSYGQYPAPAASGESSRSGKRSYDSVFNPSSTQQPLYNGMRPSSSHRMFDDDDDSISVDQLRMQYKRADGTSYSRELPVLE